MSRVAVIDGHPDPSPDRFVHALAEAYADGASERRHEVRRIDLASLDFPLIRGREEWQSGQVPPAIREAQETIAWADHLVFLYPLWLGDVPALLKGFVEQVFRPNFAMRYRESGLPEKLLAGKTARIFVTMGMPGLFYRLVYRAHSLRSFERNILRFVGIRPRSTVIGSVEGSAERRGRWLAYARELGYRGS